MAHLKAEVDADITPLEKKLKEAAKKAQEFAKEAGKTLNDIAKDAGFGGLTKLLGLGGATASITAFGAAIVEAIKGGVEEAGKFQTEAFEMGTVLKDMDLGKEMTEWAENTDTAVGTAEERVQALKSLMQSGLDAEQAKTQFQEFADVVAGAGGNLADMAEGFRHMSIGQGEEKTSGMQRFMRSSGAIEQMVRDDKTAYENQLKQELSGIPRQKSTMGLVEEKQEQLKHVQGMSLVDYSKEFLKPEDIKAMEASATGPGGQYYGKAQAKANTFEGAEAQFKHAVAEAERELATSILPTLTTWLKTMTASLQENAPTIKKLGEDLGALAEIISHMAENAGVGIRKAQDVSGPAFKPLVNTALMGPANAVGMTIFEAILEHMKSTSESSKETAGVVKATFGTQ